MDADDADYRDLKFRGEKKLSALICEDLCPIKGKRHNRITKDETNGLCPLWFQFLRDFRG